MANWEKLIEENYKKKSKIDTNTIYELIEQVLLEEGYQDSDIIKKHSSMRLSTKGKKKAGGDPFEQDPPKERSKSAPAGFGVLEEEEVLEESSLNWRELNTYDWRLRLFLDELQKGAKFKLKDGTEVSLPPEKNEELINKLEDLVKTGGKLKGLIKVVTDDGRVINTNLLSKTEAYGGKANKGDVAEGVLGAALYARFMNPNPERDITPKDIREVLNKVANIGGGSKPGKSEAILKGTVDKDKVNFKVALAPLNFAALVSNEDAVMNSLSRIYQSSAAYVNAEQIVDDAMKLEMDGRPNIIDIISDGVSDQKGTKVDVKVMVDGKPVRLGNISLKNLSKTMGQTGSSWEKIDKKTGEATSGISHMFNKTFGIAPSDTHKKEYSDAVTAFLATTGKEDPTQADKAAELKIAAKKVYEEIVKKIKTFRGVKGNASPEAEAQFIQNVVNGIKYAITKGDDTVKLLSFGGGTYKLLDLATLPEAFKDVDLDIAMEESDNPKMTIKDKNSGMEFIQIRMKLETKPTVRHYIEKLSGLDAIMSKAKKEAQKEQPSQEK